MTDDTAAQIEALEQQVAKLIQDLQARDRLIMHAAARVAELEEAMKIQAIKVRDANMAKRAAEVHAAAVIDSAGGQVEVSKETLRKVNPDTVLDVHTHSKKCACEQEDGARVVARLTEYTGARR